MNMCIYIYICLCLCVCVYKERQREKKKEIEIYFKELAHVIGQAGSSKIYTIDCQAGASWENNDTAQIWKLFATISFCTREGQIFVLFRFSTGQSQHKSQRAICLTPNPLIKMILSSKTPYHRNFQNIWPNIWRLGPNQVDTWGWPSQYPD